MGKNLVKMMMDGAGIEMVDLGVDVPEEKFVEKAEEYRSTHSLLIKLHLQLQCLQLKLL